MVSACNALGENDSGTHRKETLKIEAQNITRVGDVVTGPPVTAENLSSQHQP